MISWQALVEAGTIAPGDLDLFAYVESPAEAWQRIADWPAS